MSTWRFAPSEAEIVAVASVSPAMVPELDAEMYAESTLRPPAILPPLEALKEAVPMVPVPIRILPSLDADRETGYIESSDCTEIVALLEAARLPPI